MKNRIEAKEKPCKGTGKAKGHGCGKMVLERVYGLGKYCCYKSWLLNTPEGKERINKATLKATKPRRELEQAEKQRIANKSMSSLLLYLRDICHEYIRTRDKGKPCISCGCQWHSDFQAGHYKKAELISSLKFDERNINGQCVKCNIRKDGNIEGYRIGLIERYGSKYLEELDKEAVIYTQSQFKWSREELNRLKEYYRRKLKQLK